SPRSFAAEAQKHSSLDRNRPPTGDGMARLSDTPARRARSRPKAKGILLSTGIARLLARHDPPLGHPGSRRSFAAEGQRHSSLDRYLPPAGTAGSAPRTPRLPALARRRTPDATPPKRHAHPRALAPP